MKTVLTFDVANKLKLPVQFQNEDVRFPDSFAEYFIRQFSKPGDTVFDPFSGFGTTLYAAERLGRYAFGVEFLPERVAYIKSNLQNPERIFCASSLELDKVNLPIIDFSLTSPPYMQKKNHPEYPFAGYKVTGQVYDDYLRDIANIYRQIKNKLKQNAYVVIEVSNLSIDGEFTPLAWDIAESVGEVLTFKQEIIINWKSEKTPTYGFGYDHSYVLVFQN